MASRLGDIPTVTTPYVVTKEKCQEAFDSLSDDDRGTLLRIHGRVKAFAEAQRGSVQDVEVDIPGGKAGHTVSPCRGELLVFDFVSILVVECAIAGYFGVSKSCRPNHLTIYLRRKVVDLERNGLKKMFLLSCSAFFHLTCKFYESK